MSFFPTVPSGLSGLLGNLPESELAKFAQTGADNASTRANPNMPNPPAQAMRAFDPRLVVGPPPSAPRYRNDLMSSLLAARAVMNGDYGSGLRYQMASNEGRRTAEQSALAQQQAYARDQMVAGLPGMTEREFATYRQNPDEWGKANASRYAAATLSEKDTRVYGDPNNGGSIYQAPRLVQDGVDTVRIDPSMRDAPKLVHQGMTGGQQYARALGTQPGTPQYRDALQDEMLKGNGPTAFGYDVGLESARQSNRTELEGMRADNRARLKATPSYTQANPRAPMRGGGGGGRPPTLAGAMAPIIAKVRDGKALTPGEQRAWQMYRPGRGAANGGGGAGGRIAQDANGNRVQWNGSRWVPVR